jgi:hypothetical protein
MWFKSAYLITNYGAKAINRLYISVRLIYTNTIHKLFLKTNC